MTWGTLQSAVLVVSVLVFAVFFLDLIPGLGTPVIEAARDQFKGEPGIASFDVNPGDYKDGKLDVKLDFTLRKANVNKIKYVNVGKTSYASKDIPPNIATASSGDVYKDPIKDFESLQNSVTDEGLAPGWYDFAVKITTKDNKVITSAPAEKSFKFFDEGYLEMFNGRVEGCPSGSDPKAYDLDLKGCNVVECKRSDFQDVQRLASTAKLSQGNFCYDAVLIALKQVSADFRKENGIPDSSSCGNFLSQGYSSPKVDFSACSPEQVDSFNKMSARVWLMLFACGSSVKSEEDYAKLSSAEFGSLMQQAVARTTACVEGYGNVAGLKSRLVSQGFADFGEFSRKADVESLLGKSLNPRIKGLRADAYDDRHIGLSWEVFIGLEEIKAGSYSISRSYRRWTSSAAEDKGSISISGSETSYATAAGQASGGHDFEVRIFESPGAAGNELFLAKASTGLFDDAYVETYKGGIKGCITKKGGKEDPVVLEECDVDSQKREALKTLKGADKAKREKVLSAYAKSDVDASRCVYGSLGTLQAKDGLSKDCTPEEVDRVYHNYLIEEGRYPSEERSVDDYNCILPLIPEAKNVCMVKRQVVTTLQNLGWKDLRTNKGWENSI